MTVNRHLPRSAAIAAMAVASLLLAAAPAALAAPQSWPVIPDAERAMTECAQQPGADAVWLYREVVTDHENMATKVYKRLKILKESGRDRANIEIPYYVGRQKVTDIEARVVPPQGSPRPFEGQVFDKTAVRYRRFRVSYKTFAVPDVKPGSIVEFRYRIVPDTDGGGGGDDDEDLTSRLQASDRPEEGGLPKAKELLSFPAIRWELQDDLFTRRVRYEYIAFPYIDLLFSGPCRLSWVGHKIGAARPVSKTSHIEFEMEDVPAFAEEEYMTSPEAEQMSVDVFYLDMRISDRDEFWRRESEVWQKSAARFMGDGPGLAKVRELAGDEGEPEARLRRLYDAVQALRNLSYEKGLTRKLKKEQKIKSNRSVADVLERGYGVRSDLTRTFVALARTAGFEAEVVRVSNRDDKVFRINLLSFYDQMDAELARVVVGGRPMLFDPATPYCPFGLVHWSRSNATALRATDGSPAFFTTSVYDPDLALTRRDIALKLDPGGALAGTVRTTYMGHEALVRRLEHIRGDDESRKKDFEQELADVLPPGASVTLTGIEHAADSAPELVVRYDVAIPGLAAVAGDKVLLPAYPLTGTGSYPFRHAERSFPVYFPYPFRELDVIRIELPAGLAPEVRPQLRESRNEFSAYTLACDEDGPGVLRVQRDLTVKKCFFGLDRYAAVKGFFDAARTADGEQIVLTKPKRPGAGV
jgi:hypothetical protein